MARTLSRALVEALTRVPGDGYTLEEAYLVWPRPFEEESGSRVLYVIRNGPDGVEVARVRQDAFGDVADAGQA